MAQLHSNHGEQEQPQDIGDGQTLPLALLVNMFAAAPYGLLVVDAQANIVATNGALQQLFGYRSSEIVGKPLERLAPIRREDLQEALGDGVPRGPGSGNDSCAGLQVRELLARHASGRRFPVEIRLRPLPMPQGELILASVIDTAPRGGLEAAFARVFESEVSGKVLVDAKGRMVLLNEHLATMLGHAQAELLGRHLDVLLPERHRAHHDSQMRSYLRAPSTRSMGIGRELTALHASGAELPVEIGLSELVWQDQKMTLATVVDISTRRYIETELKQANENLREFCRVASHDLQSPLRGIADLVSWIREDLGEFREPEVLRNLDRIGERVSRMERLIEDLLRYARSEQAEADCTVIDFDAVVRDILQVAPVPAGFVVEVAVDAVPILAPRTAIETVLRNLIANAVKHHDRSAGCIRVEIGNDNALCRVSVTDDGPGIPAGAHERIFRLFQTASAVGQAGSGLGLAFSKRLVEIHGGRIELCSPVLDGRGASFRFWWPRQPRRVGHA